MLDARRRHVGHEAGCMRRAPTTARHWRPNVVAAIVTGHHDAARPCVPVLELHEHGAAESDRHEQGAGPSDLRLRQPASALRNEQTEELPSHSIIARASCIPPGLDDVALLDRELKLLASGSLALLARASERRQDRVISEYDISVFQERERTSERKRASERARANARGQWSGVESRRRRPLDGALGHVAAAAPGPLAPCLVTKTPVGSVRVCDVCLCCICCIYSALHLGVGTRARFTCS